MKYKEFECKLNVNLARRQIKPEKFLVSFDLISCNSTPVLYNKEDKNKEIGEKKTMVLEEIPESFRPLIDIYISQRTFFKYSSYVLNYTNATNWITSKGVSYNLEFFHKKINCNISSSKIWFSNCFGDFKVSYL